ncbi:hypothetical protein NC797_14915 [Aquibacillus sp. 3ASR75-11]|uniref:Uncharacterized protein n=1 Tax=Terrihalobacillus insolitus TaxID=2950438 RepID=A0A9X4AMU1_9BACI|nr:hypothetical protein [Terrihalobacillus insolitus]MDC3414321.1 hypothetical protein [Terrihalobacillus insolitus]MDC3425797.1 hypothetical protein [Terrihalobacillus insolitus]
MIKHTKAGKIIFWLGFLLFMFGASPITGMVEYSPITPNKWAAISFLALGLAMIFLSNFHRKRR